MDYTLVFISSILPILMVAAVVVLIVVLAKKGAFSTKAAPQITMREGEFSILAAHVVWMQKKIYLNKYSIPHGVLDITNQRVVYTRLSGDKVDFALEKSEIATVIRRGKIGVKIVATNGADYVINIMPPTHVENAMAQMGVPIQ